MRGWIHGEKHEKWKRAVFFRSIREERRQIQCRRAPVRVDKASGRHGCATSNPGPPHFRAPVEDTEVLRMVSLLS